MAARVVVLLVLSVARVLTVPLEAAFQGTKFSHLLRACLHLYFIFKQYNKTIPFSQKPFFSELFS